MLFSLQRVILLLSLGEKVLIHEADKQSQNRGQENLSFTFHKQVYISHITFLHPNPSDKTFFNFPAKVCDELVSQEPFSFEGGV